jgi:hypothetical protein
MRVGHVSGRADKPKMVATFRCFSTLFNTAESSAQCLSTGNSSTRADLIYIGVSLLLTTAPACGVSLIPRRCNRSGDNSTPTLLFTHSSPSTHVVHSGQTGLVPLTDIHNEYQLNHIFGAPTEWSLARTPSYNTTTRAQVLSHL